MSENLAYNLISTARERPDFVALRVGETAITYADLDSATARVARLLRQRGHEPGDRVGIMLPNGPEFAYVYYGVLRAGGGLCR